LGIDYKYGDFENIILNAIWHLEESGKDIVSVLDIQTRINAVEGKEWAYTTVKTVMDRLVQKALISRLKQGKKYFYKSSFSRLEMGSMNIRKIIKQYYNDNMQEFMINAENVCQNVFVNVTTKE
jgi:predicted transcriptional regulator